MAKENNKSDSQNLPTCAVEFIKQLLKKMRYRRKTALECYERQKVMYCKCFHFRVLQRETV
jgi:hypothetical protein